MRSPATLFFALILSLVLNPVFAKKNESTCCSKMGGPSYCDSSAGRVVCKNGFYSTCYCTPHAVMDLQLLRGCCLWRGGVVAAYSPEGTVICNDGSVSEECSLIQTNEKIAAW